VKRQTTLPVLHRPLRILLAEDNKVNQQFATALLRKAGHHVEVAENGHQAVDAVRRGDFDVVLMDIQMPELDGIGATRQIRGLDSPKCEIPIIAMTAHAMTGAREEYLAAGMNDYITKPVEVALLFSKLDKLVSSASPVVAAHADRNPKTVSGTVLAREDTPLDLDTLAGLEDTISLPNLNEIVAMYLTDTKILLLQIAEASAKKDFQKVSFAAHTIISTAGNIGALKTSMAARRLEAACRTGEVAGIYALIGQLNEAYIGSSNILCAWQNRQSTRTQIAV
jgi:CheY-like chemotaxis protein